MRLRSGVGRHSDDGQSGSLDRLGKMGWRCVGLSAVGVLAIAGCGSGGGSHVPAVWREVDNCLESHPAFIGNVVAESQGGPPGAKGTLSIASSGDLAGFVANAYRYASPAAATAGENGVGPPGPTVSFYRNIALEVNSGTSRRDDSFISRCFDRTYGLPTSATSARHRAQRQRPKGLAPCRAGTSRDGAGNCVPPASSCPSGTEENAAGQCMPIRAVTQPAPSTPTARPTGTAPPTPTATGPGNTTTGGNGGAGLGSGT
jgi:hypothetical protein